MEVSILQAKTEFSKLIHLLEDKREDSITVSRYGKPVAKIILYEEQPAARRIGVLQGMPYKSMTQEEFDRDNKEIAELFTGENDEYPA